MKKTILFLLIFVLAFSTKTIAQVQDCVGASPKSVINQENKFIKHTFNLIDSTRAVEKVKLNKYEQIDIKHYSCYAYVLIYQTKFKHIEGASSKELIEKGLELLEAISKVNASVFELNDEIKDFKKYIASPDFDSNKFYKHVFCDENCYIQKEIEKIIIGKKYDEVYFKLWINL